MVMEMTSLSQMSVQLVGVTIEVVTPAGGKSGQRGGGQRLVTLNRAQGCPRGWCASSGARLRRPRAACCCKTGSGWAMCGLTGGGVGFEGDDVPALLAHAHGGPAAHGALEQVHPGRRESGGWVGECEEGCEGLKRWAGVRAVYAASLQAGCSPAQAPNTAARPRLTTPGPPARATGMRRAQPRPARPW